MLVGPIFTAISLSGHWSVQRPRHYFNNRCRLFLFPHSQIQKGMPPHTQPLQYTYIHIYIYIYTYMNHDAYHYQGPGMLIRFTVLFNAESTCLLMLIIYIIYIFTDNDTKHIYLIYP